MKDIDEETQKVEEKSEFDRVQEAWPGLSHNDRIEAFQNLRRADAEELFLTLGATDQYHLIEELPWPEKRSWLRLLAPDDAADLIQEFPIEERGRVISLLDPVTAKEVTALLAYAEDEAGGLMNPRFIRLRPDVTVDVAIRYLRAQARGTAESIHYGYVLDPDQRLLGTVSFRELLLESPDKLVSEIMTTDLVTLPEQMDQEQVSREFAKYDLASLPVVDDEGRMKGIVTVDDVVDVVEEEATEDIQKLGGSEALDEPYMRISLPRMIRKRAIWLVVLFLGEMLTTVAMGHYELDIQRAVVLALFIPLIISSGGNSGSQATSMIIRAIALQEVRLRDWWRVLTRELVTGLSLGAILGGIGLLRILLTPSRADVFGEHYLRLGLTVSVSLVGVVLLGSVTGAMLPFALRRIGLDPATASAPLVATLVDVTGLIMYFTLSSLILGGLLF